jgi:hypothetical protein
MWGISPSNTVGKVRYSFSQKGLNFIGVYWVLVAVMAIMTGMDMGVFEASPELEIAQGFYGMFLPMNAILVSVWGRPAQSAPLAGLAPSKGPVAFGALLLSPSRKPER